VLWGARSARICASSAGAELLERRDLYLNHPGKVERLLAPIGLAPHTLRGADEVGSPPSTCSALLNRSLEGFFTE
jgi:hypothetical protein